MDIAVSAFAGGVNWRLSGSAGLKSGIRSCHVLLDKGNLDLIVVYPHRVTIKVAAAGAMQALAGFHVEYRLMQRAFHLAIFDKAPLSSA